MPFPSQPSIQVFITAQCDLSPTVLAYFINKLLVLSHSFSLLSAYLFFFTFAKLTHRSQYFNPIVCFYLYISLGSLKQSCILSFH